MGTCHTYPLGHLTCPKHVWKCQNKWGKGQTGGLTALATMGRCNVKGLGTRVHTSCVLARDYGLISLQVAGLDGRHLWSRETTTTTTTFVLDTLIGIGEDPLVRSFSYMKQSWDFFTFRNSDKLAGTFRWSEEPSRAWLVPSTTADPTC